MESVPPAQGAEKTGCSHPWLLGHLKAVKSWVTKILSGPKELSITELYAKEAALYEEARCIEGKPRETCVRLLQEFLELKHAMNARLGLHLEYADVISRLRLLLSVQNDRDDTDGDPVPRPVGPAGGPSRPVMARPEEKPANLSMLETV